MGVNKEIPLKVLMTADTVGGVWTYTIELCRSMRIFNIHFHVVTLGAAMSNWQKKEIRSLKNVTVYETTFPLEWMDNPWKEIDQSVPYFRELEQKIEPDLVHLNNYSYAAIGWSAPVLLVAHSDVYSWWRAVKGEDPPKEWSTYFTRVKEGLEQANYVVAPSYSMMHELNSIYSVFNNQSVIYNARSKFLFQPAVKEEVVLGIGRIWDKAKNISLLVEAAPQIPFNIKIAGDHKFDKTSFSSGSKDIEHLGKLSSQMVAKHLSSASIYAHPAKYEPFGLSVLEAALAGCALVLSDISSLREIWQDNALYTDPYHPDELVYCINTLIREPEIMKYMADKARKHARQFNTRKMGDEYFSLYTRLLVNTPSVVKSSAQYSNA